LLFSNTLQHPPQYPTRHDHSEEKSHQRHSSVQIHDSPYGENISPNIFEQSTKQSIFLRGKNFLILHQDYHQIYMDYQDQISQKQQDLQKV